jgi:hypothetical protein
MWTLVDSRVGPCWSVLVRVGGRVGRVGHIFPSPKRSPRLLHLHIPPNT